MRDKDIIEVYLKSLKDELLMYSDGISERNLCYIKDLKKAYNCWEHDLEKLDPNYISKKKMNNEHKDVASTEVDNNLYEAIDEFLAYKGYYDDYLRTGSNDKIEMAYQELQHFLNIIGDVFEEISNTCKDDSEAKTIVKSAIKTMYTKFS